MKILILFKLYQNAIKPIVVIRKIGILNIIVVI